MTKTADVYTAADPPYADKLRIAIGELERGETETFADTHAMFAKILAEDENAV